MNDTFRQESHLQLRRRSTTRDNHERGHSDTKRILILTTDTGYGHRSSAKAIATALQELHTDACLIDIVNPMNDARTPDFLREGQTDYDKAVRETPDLYKLGYQFSDLPLAVAIIESGLTVMLSEIMRDVLRHYRPDAIVTTHQNYLAPLKAVFEIESRRIPLFTVVTDLAIVHQMWFNDVSDLCLVPTESVRDQALKHGLAPEKVKVTGIPVSPHIACETREPNQIREELGWDKDLTTVLVVGGKRVSNLPDALRILNHSALPLQLAIVAGGDDDLYRHLQNTTWHVPTHPYNFVHNLPTLMRASDCVMGKAGGLILSESLACGLPLILVDIIHGQETGNADYVIQRGAAELAKSPLEVLDIMSHWLQNGGELLAQRAQSAQEMGRPNAAYDVAEPVWAAAQRGPLSQPKSIFKGLSNLTELFSRLDIGWNRETDT
jgi:1,2-diacylglycerol 3-beta-galactosyltransferase